MTRSQAWILTSAQQRALDEASVLEGTSAETLMESAGAHAAKWMLANLHPEAAVVLAGPGGNGGDAFVVARHLLQAGVRVQTISRNDIESSSSLTQLMARRLMDLNGSIRVIPLEPAALEEALKTADCVIDGLFGSGLSRPLEGEDAVICQSINQSNAVTVSLDVPSGVASDVGDLWMPAVRADITLAMAFHKPCHWLHPAAEFCGDVHIVAVDYPQAMLDRVAPMAMVPNRESIAAMLPKRRPTGHKGTFGRVLIIAGSQGMTGAAILCARGALRAGAGLVTVALPEAIAQVIQTAVPEAITLLLPDERSSVSGRDFSQGLLSAMADTDVIAMGPGLGRAPDTLEWVRMILEASESKLVIDADAIHALVGADDVWTAIAGRSVLTPHPGEFAALVGSTAGAVDLARLDLAETFVSKHATHLVLKGRPTVIGSPNQSMIVNPTGNTGLATGGSGDVLTGLLAGLIAGGSSLSDAAITAPYIHGWIADRWATTYSERSLTPSDILDDLPRVLKELES